MFLGGREAEMGHGIAQAGGACHVPRSNYLSLECALCLPWVSWNVLPRIYGPPILSPLENLSATLLAHTILVPELRFVELRFVEMWFVEMWFVNVVCEDVVCGHVRRAFVCCATSRKFYTRATPP
jgi:hypothetical protein